MKNFFIKPKEKEVAESQEKINPHRHSWELIFKTQAQPVSLKDANFKSAVPGTEERMLLGCTDLLFECECGVSKREQLLGFEVDDSDLGKSFGLADRYGHSVVEHSGKKYVVMPAPERYPVRQQRTTTTPKRPQTG